MWGLAFHSHKWNLWVRSIPSLRDGYGAMGCSFIRSKSLAEPYPKDAVHGQTRSESPIPSSTGSCGQSPFRAGFYPRFIFKQILRVAICIILFKYIHNHLQTTSLPYKLYIPYIPSMLYALCSMLYALCFMPYALYPLIPLTAGLTKPPRQQFPPHRLTDLSRKNDFPVVGNREFLLEFPERS